MTTPSQLNYLDAMGIPVWVSRDQLIVEIKKTSLEADKQETIKNPSAQEIIKTLDATKSSAKTDRDNKDETLNNNTKPTLISPARASQQANKKDKNLLVETEHHAIYVCGNENADWMIIGHSPETFTGIGEEPFSGEAGQLLDNMLRSVGLQQPRLDAYLLNILSKGKSVVGENINDILISTIKKVQPRVLLIVGQNAAQSLLKNADPLITMRGKVHQLPQINTSCVVTYYPSYLLQKPIDKRKAWDDLKLAMSVLN